MTDEFKATVTAASKRRRKKPAEPTLKQQLAEACAEMGGDAGYHALLDHVADKLPPIILEQESKSSTVNPKIVGITFRQIIRRDAPPPEYLVQNLIPKEGVGALSGEPKAAKSWDATYYAVCVAAGRSPFDKFAVHCPAPVFYYYAEDTEAAVKTRVLAIAAELGLDPDGDWVDRLVMQPRGRPLDVMNTAQLCVLAASVNRYSQITGQKFALLILDPLSNIHSGEEDKRDSMVKVMARLHALEQYLGLAILFIHHSGKENADTKGRKRGGQKMRGSSAIHGAVDFGLYLSHLRGDMKTEFIARVESEMKAARSAGTFDRTLKIQDSEKGNAERATFSASEPGDDTIPTDLASERALDVVKKLFDQGAPLTRDALKKKIGGSSAIFERAVVIASNEGWIAQRFHGKHSQGYEVTETGKALIRDGVPVAEVAP
ncbi:MAG: AAA family ATPase [Deltaproteobacteria bacterium]|nr:AAA family ATPase [Deltaproteobacteria bacterium]